MARPVEVHRSFVNIAPFFSPLHRIIINIYSSTAVERTKFSLEFERSVASGVVLAGEIHPDGVGPIV